MLFARCALLATAVGCSLTTMEANSGDDKTIGKDEATIKGVVDHFDKNGVKLKTSGRGEWVVTDPKADGYEVVVHLRTFPADATEQQMRAELRMLNLAHILNAPARLAMSYPGLRGTDPTSKLPKLDQVPVVAKLEKLFKEYRPPEPKK